jgi:hypothetical protein
LGEERKVGRPLKEVPAGDSYSKHTIKVLDSIWEELGVYGLRNKITISDLLEKLAKDFIENQK